MDWLTKNHPGEATISPADVKLCELCGTLNHKTNGECFTCGWRGHFCAEAAPLEIAWLRLTTEFEAIRMEHVSARRSRILGHFGQVRKTNRWQRCQAACLAWWQTVRSRRPQRVPEQKPSPSRMPPAL